MIRDPFPVSARPAVQQRSRATARRSRLGRRIAAVAIAWAALQGGAAAADFTFAALGDAPYNADEETRFLGVIAGLNREPLAFVVHVGDFKSAIERCSDELFRQRREWFDLVRHPLVFVPGDNEWIDCRRTIGQGYEPLERLRKLREIFAGGNASLGQRTIRLARQTDVSRGAHAYPEHARWEHEGVLFLTLNAPGPDNNAHAMPEEHARRSAAIRAWLEDGFRLARVRGVKAVVVAMHANPWRDSGPPRRGFGELVATLAAETARFPGEVLLVHGDTHHYRVDRPALRARADGPPLANFTRIEVFGSPWVNWVRVRVSVEAGRVVFSASPGN